MRIAYIDMIGGVSGDMLLGALIDAGLPLADLRSALDKLGIDGFELFARRVKRGGVDSTLVEVKLDESGSRTRDWAEFDQTISDSALDDSVKSTVHKVFGLLAEAESAAHGVSKEATHLHELGTVDTLVDVVGVIAGFELLGIEKVHASPFPISSGTSKSSHGVMAATAAATAEIYRIIGAQVRVGGTEGPSGEAVTPTGAALVSVIATFSPTSFSVRRKGYGAGTRDPESHPNVVGLWIGDSSSGSTPGDPGSKAETETVVLLETNIDDMTGEALGYVQEMLMEAGALDVWMTPVQMKKGRPGTLLSILCQPGMEKELVRLILRESTTLGVRRRAVERYVAERETIVVSVHGSDVDVKVKRLDGDIAGLHPEYEQCREIAMRSHLTLLEVTHAATEAARTQLGL